MIHIDDQEVHRSADLGIHTAQTGDVAYFAHLRGFLLGVPGGFAPRLT